MCNPESLNARFAIPGQLGFETGPGGLCVAKISNAHGEAMISLSGGHVMSWQPAGQSPVLWLSHYAKFAPGKSIRGGVPVCWPWFGPHPSESSFPGHGFARTVPWTVEAVSAQAGNEVQIILNLQASDATRAQWPHPSHLSLAVTMGRTLRFALITQNTGSEAIKIGEALHTYFAVSDIRQAKIRGLEGCRYMDKVAGGAEYRQEGPIVISSEVDRVYLDTVADCLIDDPGLQRRIRIRKENSRSTVVWNPWIEKAEKMGDFGPEGYLGMVCVESGNALDNVVTVPPGASHTLRVEYSVEALAE